MLQRAQNLKCGHSPRGTTLHRECVQCAPPLLAGACTKKISLESAVGVTRDSGQLSTRGRVIGTSLACSFFLPPSHEHAGFRFHFPSTDLLKG